MDVDDVVLENSSPQAEIFHDFGCELFFVYQMKQEIARRRRIFFINILAAKSYFCKGNRDFRVAKSQNFRASRDYFDALPNLGFPLNFEKKSRFARCSPRPCVSRVSSKSQIAGRG